MTLGKKLAKKITRWRENSDQTASPAKGGTTWRQDEPRLGVTAQVIVPDSDKYSFVVREIAVFFDSGLHDSEALRKQAEELLKRVAYLPERLALIELDDGRQIAQVRSQPPSTEGEHVHYFELLLQQGRTITMRRYKGKAASRKQENFILSVESFIRVIDDLAAVRPEEKV